MNKAVLKAHEALVKNAKAAINDVYSDTKVPKDVTLSSMQELQDEISININVLKEEM